MGWLASLTPALTGLELWSCRRGALHLSGILYLYCAEHYHPAGLSRLEKQGGLATAFDAITVGALLRASGCDASYKIHRNESSVVEEWNVVA